MLTALFKAAPEFVLLLVHLCKLLLVRNLVEYHFQEKFAIKGYNRNEP